MKVVALTTTLLTTLGFTPTESKVYCALLALGPATGYRAAREASLARANVYHALEALLRRGVIERVGSEPSRFRAVEPDEFSARVGQEFAERLESARRELRAIPVRAPARVAGADDDEAAAEAITDWRRLGTCWRQSLDSADREVLAAVGPWVRALYPGLEDLGRRGVATRVLALGSPAPRGAVLRAVPPAELVEYWGGLPFAAVVDRRTAVFGIVGAGGMPVAQLSESPAAVPFVRHVLRRELTAPLGSAAHAPGPAAGRAPGARGSA